MRRTLETAEKELWGRVIATVEPMHAAKNNPLRGTNTTLPTGSIGEPQRKDSRPSAPATIPTPPSRSEASVKTKPGSLDGHWDRRIDRGAIIPDISVDLHGSGLSGAYARLDGALEQAISQRLKVILLVTGKARSHDRATGQGRGAIASVVRDWLDASRHSRSIAAVRPAHPRHGGAGALYIVLRT